MSMFAPVTTTGTGYDLISFGSDGVEGGTSEADDVVSWVRRDE